MAQCKRYPTSEVNQMLSNILHRSQKQQPLNLSSETAALELELELSIDVEEENNVKDIQPLN